jgi:hypothetical protein
MLGEESTGTICVTTKKGLHFHMSMLELLLSILFLKQSKGHQPSMRPQGIQFCFLRNVRNHFVLMTTYNTKAALKHCLLVN